jgi:phage gp16-like protein
MKRWSFLEGMPSMFSEDPKYFEELSDLCNLMEIVRVFQR